MSTTNSRTIIICIGNELIADDAVGFEIFNRLADCNVRLEFCSVGGIDILSLLDGETNMIVVDAVQFDAAPGTVHVIPWDSLPRSSSVISAHGLGLRETIEIGRILYPQKMPDRITLVGIEGRCFNRTREYMTDEVRDAIGTAVATIEELIKQPGYSIQQAVTIVNCCKEAHIMNASVYEVVKQLSDAMVAGQLDSRGDLTALTGQDAETIRLINDMIDALVTPMRLAGNALEEIAHGKLPPFVIDDYQGEYSRIKQNINTLLAILYGLHGETEHLISSISRGKLKTRGNDWDYEGIWKELIGGMNTALDAVIEPISEAGAVLERLARYDLKARMSGKYRGEHAAIRKAMNTTAESLHEAISHVSETVGFVSDVGKQIIRISALVTKGAEEQSVQLNEVSMSLASLSESARYSSQSTTEAHGNAKLATDAVLKAKDSMNGMVVSMNDISGAAENTISIANEIDGIARETGTLAGGAVEKAVRMRISAGGFGVVAQEIRNLSRKCSETASSMKSFEKKMSEDQQEEFGDLIANLMSIARFSNLLGVNAAIESAHVEGAGNEFKVMTDEIHNLAVRSAEAANKTSVLTKSSASLSKKGVLLSHEIDRQLDGAVQGAHALSAFADDIYTNILEQTSGLEQISQTTSQISLVTDKNAEGAAESLEAAKNLEQQVGSLTKLVNRFTF